MASSSFSESSPEYPSPSTTLNVANFVSIKLSKDNYPLWKAQMNCLIVSQDLVGFIDGSISQPAEPTPGQLTNQDYLVWRRTDHLLKGWIFGSLSEEVLVSVIHLKTSSNVWNDLEEKLSPPSPSPEEKKGLQATSEEERDLTEYVGLYKAALDGDWKFAEEFFKVHEDALSSVITKSSETVLHIAVGAGQKAVNFVGKLVEKMPAEALSFQDSEGDTALSVAAITGNTKAAKILVNKRPNLVHIVDRDDRLPVHLAARYGNEDTTLHLIGYTELSHLDKQLFCVDLIESGYIHMVDFFLEGVVQGQLGSILTAIARKPSAFPSGSFLNLWQKLIYQCVPAHVNPDVISRPMSFSFSFRYLRYRFISACRGSYILHSKVGRLYGEIKKISQKKKVHHDAIELVKKLCLKITSSNDLQSDKDSALKEALFVAGRLGIEEVVEEIVLEYPDAIWFKDENNCNIFQLAIIQRQEHVFKLIYCRSGQQRYLTSIKDPSDNNILHLAGKLAPRHKLELIPGPVLQMQHELQWFMEVENLVNSTQKNELNCYAQTPSMIFSDKHKELVVEGQNWLKGMATSATTILISAIIFAATFSIPGGYNGDDDRLSNSSKHSAFMVFVISESISLFASTTSLLVFLSILTTRFAEKDFLIDLPTRLIIGLFSLFLSITSMMITFCATLYLVFGQKEKWVIVPMITLACLPVSSFMFLQFPLFAYLISSTYGPGIFHKHR